MKLTKKQIDEIAERFGKGSCRRVKVMIDLVAGSLVGMRLARVGSASEACMLDMYEKFSARLVEECGSDSIDTIKAYLDLK